MSATYKAAAATLKNIEGGYCSGGSQCGGPASGETYRGIDRKQQPQWAGWRLIDDFKKRNGTPKWRSYFTGTFGAQIDKLVEEFWTVWWNRYGFNLLKNQYLAELLYVWSAQGQNRALADINNIGRAFGAKKFSNTTITPEVAAAINTNLASAYQMARQRITKWYMDNRPRDYSTFIKNRVDIFPAAISNTSIQTTPRNIPATPSTPRASNSGSALGWLAAIFSTIKII